MDLFSGDSQPNEIIHKVQELGAAFTSSVDACQQHILGLMGGASLDAQMTAKMITAMVTTPESSFLAAVGKTSWEMLLGSASSAASATGGGGSPHYNGTVFIAAVRALAPGMEWHEVFQALDNPHFCIRSKSALQLLTLVLISGIAPSPFPVGQIYRLWKNKSAQLSWLTQIIHHPDVFYVLDYPHTTVANLGCLKVFPDEGNRAIGVWKCLELVEALFRIGEDFPPLGNQVLLLLRGPGPMVLCPDLLFLAVVQISTPMTQFRIHVLKYLVSTLLTVHPNTSPVLQFAWNFEAHKGQMRQILLTSMGAYYAQNPEDQTRLTRILEIAHELKALSELLNMTQFPFVIDLAILAARRDFLKLDKFIEDKLTEHGERFAQDLCQVLKRRCPGMATNNPMPTETFQLIFSVLQSRTSSWPTISAELSQMVAQIRGKAIPGMGSSTPFGAGAPPFVPMKMSESRMSAGTPGIGGNPFTFFQQREQIMRNLRSTPGIETRDFRHLSSVHSVSPNNSLDFGDDLTNAVFNEEIQEEVNSYFQHIYAPNGRMSVDEFIGKLKNFRMSGNPREKELLLCVVKNLFDEYRFFADYPERELKTTAEVYGGIIREGIVSNIQFATAIRRVLGSLNDEPGNPLWTFGIVALSSCRTCLHKYPKVCQMISSLENFSRFPPSLKDYVNAGMQGQLPHNHAADRETTASWSGQPFIPIGSGSSSFNTPIAPNQNISAMKFSAPRGIASGNSLLGVASVDTLINATEREGTQVNQPPQSVFEKVAFVCNNLCSNNLMDKTQEINELIVEGGEEFMQWFAQYMVMKRITVEQNFQPLYNSFLVLINNPLLDNFVRKETYRNINILLRSDKRQAASNFGDRQLLKNLGHWLGIITVGRDQPILAKDLDLKYLLIDAFYKGQQELLYIIPFVVKCLTASSKSTIFGPRCSWIYSILKVLVEIHNEPDLKLNLKFEIEVLCKEVNIDLRSVEVSNYLKESSRLPKLIPQEGHSPIPPQPMFPPGVPIPHSAAGGLPIEMRAVGSDYAADMLSSMNISCLAMNKESPSFVHSPALAQQQHKSSNSSQPQHIIPAFNYNDPIIFTHNGFMQSIVIPQHLMLFQMQPHLKNVCRGAIFHAIKELIGAIADRSISVAITATEHVCRKDFSLDSNEQNLRRATHQMMRSLTAAMAAITCREPLTTTMLGLLKQALCNAVGANLLAGSDQTKMIDEAAIAVTEANIILATNFIVKNACEKAVSEIEKRMEQELAARRLASKENRLFQGDPAVMSMIDKLPESIKLQPGSITDTQLKIYDDFSSKICGFRPLSSEERFIESSRRSQMTPAGLSRTPTNAFAIPFIPSSMAINDGRPSMSGLQGILAPQHPQQFLHASVIAGERMSLPPGILPDEQSCFMTSGLSVRKMNEDQLLQNKVENILREWITICYTPMAQRDPQHALACIVQMMHDNGVLATDEMITKFFKLCADICFDVSYRLLKNECSGQSTVVRQRCYYTLDAFTKLTCLMVKYSDGQHHSTKVNLLKKVLGILTSALNKDHEQRKYDFNGMPFHRILIIMFNELTAPDPVLDPIQWNILEAFGQALFMLQPKRVPGFAFHWLDIIGHRNFIGRLLAESFDLTKTGAMYTQLILCHLKFLAPFLRNVHLPKAIAYIYKGTLRVLLVILHDFPEILCEYHYVLCDAIPPNCVQLRNLILSAYPRDMRLPDPFTENLSKIENLAEMSSNPKTHREINNIIPQELRKRLDDYLETRSSVNFLSDLPGFLLCSPQQQALAPGSKYNISVINAVVMYVGVRAIDSIHDKGQRISTDMIAHTAFMDIFQNLAVSLCTEGRYLLFNAIANQLRYPNSHTHYFSCTLLYLFLEANSEHIQEQITRILFERLVALRPHPWGLLITFIELIRNPRYTFWKHNFVRCAPEIERLFMSVANSCSVTGPEHSNGN